MKKKAALFLAAMMAVGTAVPASAADSFKDINDVPWGGAQAYINSVFESGLMVGEIDENGNRVFHAKNNISYTETAQLVYSLSGTTVSTDVVQKWTSVMKSNKIPSWAYNCVAYCLENSIVTITDLNIFYNADGSARSATREDAAYIFGRFLVSQNISAATNTKNFADKNNISAVCQQYVDILSSYDIFVGDDDNKFNPNNTINRAEMAVIVSKTYNMLKDKSIVNDDGEKTTKADYTGYINYAGPDFNGIGPKAFMLYTYDGQSIVLDTVADSQYYLDGEPISTRGIYSLTSNGVLVSAEVYVNSRNQAMEIYCKRAAVEGQVTNIGTKKTKDKNGDEYSYRSVTIKFASGMTRSYRIDDDTDIYFDDDEIDIDELEEYLDEYPEIFGSADVQYNDEYDVYPNAYVKELKTNFILKEEGTISEIDGETVKIVADDGREYEYKLDSVVRYYLDGKKVRLPAFREGVYTNVSKVQLTFDNLGYVTRIEAEKYAE